MPLDGTPAGRPAPVVVHPECLRAAAVLKKWGWVTRYWGDPGIGYCLIGAYKQSGDRYDSSFARLLGFKGVKAAIQWNDARGRTEAEVLDRLERGARGEFDRPA